MRLQLLTTSLVAALFGLAAFPAAATLVFDQGFETDTAGWTAGGGFGGINRVGTGTNGVTSFEGGYHAVFTQSDSGPYTFFDGSRDTYPGTYSASAAIYLDTDWDAGTGFDYSVASYDTSGDHLQDFIFHVTMDTSTRNLLVGGSNNTNFDPQENLESGNHFWVKNSGWYIFEHLFRNVGGQLEVDLNLYNALGTLLFTETRIDPANQIPSVVGGNGYGWFTNIDINGGIAVDRTRLRIASVPEPGSLVLLLSGLAAFGVTRQSRRKVRLAG